MWFRVNDLLPDGLQKPLPDRSPEMHQPGADIHEGIQRPANKTNPMPRRSPPPPPSTETTWSSSSSPVNNSMTSGGGGALGAFWSTQHAKDSFNAEDKVAVNFDEEPSKQNTTRLEQQIFSHDASPSKEEKIRSHPVTKTVHANSVNRASDSLSQDFGINFFKDDSGQATGRPKASKSNSESTNAFQNEAFNSFVADFDTNKLSPGISSKNSGKEEELEAEVERLKEQLKQANIEKAEITSKYEKLSAICRSQRQEIQELKQALGAGTSPNRGVPKDKTSPGVQPSAAMQREKIEGTVWELQQRFFDSNTPSPESKPWNAFTEDAKPQKMSTDSTPKSVRTRNGHQNKQATPAVSEAGSWGFGTDNFTAVPTASSQMPVSSKELKTSQRYGELKNVKSESVSQPAGWAGF